MRRPASSLLEMLIVCVIVGLVAAMAAPRVHAALDSIAVEGAAREVADAFAVGRLAALRYGSADVRLDSTSITVRAGGRVVHARNIVAGHGVNMRANTTVVRYAATGLGLGVGNGTVILSKGAAMDSIVISRLGRVRR